MSTHIKPEHTTEVDQLIAGLWDGEISEAEFYARGLDAGMLVMTIEAILDEVREEDGT